MFSLSSRAGRTLSSSVRTPLSTDYRLYFSRVARPGCPRIAQFEASNRYSTAAAATKGSNFRVMTVFYTLLGLGFGSTCYGLYSFYTSFTLWPPEVRQDLRAGVKAKHQGDFALSEQFLRRAYETALSLPLETFAPSPYLKLSGIAVILGEVLESNDRPKTAYETYTGCIAHLQSHWSELSGEEKMRAIAIAHKLGDMADSYQLGEDEEERWLTWSVEEVLRLSKEAETSKSAGTTAGEDEKLVLADLQLPKWVSVGEVSALIEALGAFYARTGKLEFAVPLYLQAISLLVPSRSSSKTATPEELCRGAQLMSNLSELFMRGTPTDARLHQSEAWARQALALIEKTKSANSHHSDDLQICEQALAVTLFNLASIKEMMEDPASAKDLFQRSWEQSNKIGLREGVTEARQALRRLERLQRAAQESPLSVVSDTKPTP